MVHEREVITHGVPEDEAPVQEEEPEEEEEELVDPLEVVRQKCEKTEHCVHTRHRLEVCEARVSSRSHTEEDCTEELFDFLHARDHCILAVPQRGQEPTPQEPTPQEPSSGRSLRCFF